MTKPTRDEAIGALSIFWHTHEFEESRAKELIAGLDRDVLGWRTRSDLPIPAKDQKTVARLKAYARARDVLVREGILK